MGGYVYLGERCACRQCLRLSYPVQFETRQTQGFRRAWKALRKLVQPDGNSTVGSWIPNSRKPKGMHWATFNRLRDEAAQKAVALWDGPIGHGMLNGQERMLRRLDQVCARIEARHSHKKTLT